MPEPGIEQGTLELQSNAPATELTRLTDEKESKHGSGIATI